MKGFEDLYKSEKKKNKIIKPADKQIINRAIKLHLKGDIPEATKYYQKLISQGSNDQRIFSNYGVILLDQGKLKEAEIYTRKAIQINPNNVDAHLNLGNILKDLGKLKEAEISISKAIELNPNNPIAYHNLGNIFGELGKLQYAETSYHKAIQLNPNFVEAHNNLGTILIKLGKLKEAEISTRKAIELNPNYAGALQNLGDILRDLGKLKEVIQLSKSTLKSVSVNKGYLLLSSIRLTIVNLILKNFSETLANINKTNNLINQGALNELKTEKNKNFVFTFSRFITSLYPLLEKKNKNTDLNAIPHFGESHCLSFAHQTLPICSRLIQIQPVLITGAKAWHFANNQNNQWKDSLTQQIKKHSYSDKAFISFGEIDCRRDQGILNHAIKNDKDFFEVCEETIKGYLYYMEEVLSTNYRERYYFGVPAPTIKKQLLDDLDKKRIKVIQTYNEIYKKEVLSCGSNFLDIYKLTSKKNGLNNNLYMCDEYHLSPKCLPILFEKYLYKRPISPN